MTGNVATAERGKFVLQGLDCADCSERLEQELHRHGFQDLKINFVTKSITLEVGQLQEIQKVIRQVEPDVVLVRAVPGQEEGLHTKAVRDLIPIAIAAVLFIIGLLIRQEGVIKTGLFLVAYIVVGGKVLTQAWKNILRGQVFDENFLMGIASLGAIAIGQFSEAVGVMLFYSIGEFFQDLAVERSRGSIKALLNARPDYANIEKDGQLIKIPPEDVLVGTHIVIKPGDKIPLDGKVILGTAFIDTASLTGEAVPVRVEVGDQVLAGTINTNSLIRVEVTKAYADSSLAKIFELVENAATHKAPTEKLITKFSSYYTPGVVLASLLMAVLPPLLIPGATFQQWIYRALTLLVISCPCALVLSIPLGYFGGIGAASKQGVLVKGSNYLEALTKLHTVVMDKTGTLTQGVFKVKSIISTANYSAEQLLFYAAMAESYSAHPIAKSITSAYKGKLDNHNITDYEDHAGLGVKAKIDGELVLIGRELFLNQQGISIQHLEEREAGGTVVFIAIAGKYAGFITISDEIRPDALETVSRLKQIGVEEIVMLSGDDEVETARVASALGINKFYARLLPQDKVAWVEKLENGLKPGATLAFVGDGINDAPVLAKANIGVAMGGLGSDAAIEAADVVLMEDKPLKLVTAVTIAQKTKIIVLENIVFSLGFKLIVMILGAFGFATMWEAVFADVGVAIIAILNSARMLGYKAQKPGNR
jgi:Zn2+/Cd2+-exporting ATPase